MADQYVKYPGVARSSFPLKAPDGTAGAPSYSNSTGLTGIYFSGETLQFATNGLNAGQITATQLWAMGPSTSAVSVLNISIPTTLTSTGPRGIRLGVTFPNTATVDAYGIETRVQPNAVDGTYAILGAMKISNITPGSSVVTRKMGIFVQDHTGGTNNASITDNSTWTGNYFINQSGTLPSQFGGSLVVGTAAIATNATDGFVYLPTCAGTPSGTPTTRTGTCATVYDTSANKLWIYNGAWKSVTLA